MRYRSLSLWPPLLGLFGTPAHAEIPAIPAPGMEYKRVILAQPRPIRAHVLKITAAPKLQFRMVLGKDPDGAGPAEATLTDPLELANSPNVRAFINVNPWQGMPDASGKRDSRWRAGQAVDILGLALTANSVRSAAVEYPNAAVRFTADGTVQFGNAQEGRVYTDGLNGFSPVTQGGKALTIADPAIHPRTTLGADQNGTTVWWVVVDGRQKGFSEGMTLTELGKLMHELGCWNAVNLDGGGSSVLGIADSMGKLQVVNSPSDRRGTQVKIRPLPCILTLCAQPEGVP
jgi:hypothetical protein